MVKIGIQGHPTRGKEVIQILENLGGINDGLHEGNNPDCYYELHGNIIWCVSTKGINFKYYTLEKFEEEFPFKIGDKVKHFSSICIIRKYYYINNKPVYEVESELGIIATIPVKLLESYKEMKEERNITLTFDKAKEWYKKGGELKEIALQAYSEEELNPLPRSWEEFCEKYPIKNKEAHIDSISNIIIQKGDSTLRASIRDRNICPSQKSAEAHLAMIQLEQLRDCWLNGWTPDWSDSSAKWCIRVWGNTFDIGSTIRISRFLAFPTKKMAEEFLECFRDLIEKAGDLI